MKYIKKFKTFENTEEEVNKRYIAPLKQQQSMEVDIVNKQLPRIH